jgi:hypothetical protein
VQYNNRTLFDSFTATIACATFSGHSSWCKLQLQLIYHHKAGLSRRGDLIVAFRVITPQNAADGIYERHSQHNSSAELNSVDVQQGHYTADNSR